MKKKKQKIHIRWNHRLSAACLSFFLLCSLALPVRAETKASSHEEESTTKVTAVEETAASDIGEDAVASDTEELESAENYLEVFDYLSEDNEVTELLEEIIRQRDEEFLAELEKEALLAKIRQDNENAMASVDDALKELKQEEGEKLLEEEDAASGDVAVQTFQSRLEAQKAARQEQADKKQVVSIQDVFSPNTNNTAGNYEHSMTFMITAYCPCSECNGPWSGGITSTGVTASQGRTIAVDPRIIPYGTKVLIGGHEFVAEDCGGAIKGAHIDLYLDSHERCSSWGVRYLTVSWNGGNSSMIAALTK